MQTTTPRKAVRAGYVYLYITYPYHKRLFALEILWALPRHQEKEHHCKPSRTWFSVARENTPSNLCVYCPDTFFLEKKNQL